MKSVVKCQDLQTVVPEPGFLLHMSNSRAQNHTERIEWKGEFGFDWNQERQGVPKIGKIMVGTILSELSFLSILNWESRKFRISGWAVKQNQSGQNYSD